MQRGRSTDLDRAPEEVFRFFLQENLKTLQKGSGANLYKKKQDNDTYNKKRKTAQLVWNQAIREQEN